MTKSSEHNSKLLAEYMAKSKVFSRFPRVSEQADCLPLGLESLPKFAYNPSILRINGKLLMTYRYHFSGDARTKVGICTIADGGKIENARDLNIDGFSVEDARLFSLHGEPWVSWVEAKWEGDFENPRCCVKYAQLESYLDPLEHDESARKAQIAKGFKVGRVFQPNSGGNDMKSMQKNWCFFESDENLFAIFDTAPSRFVVYQIQGDAVVNEYKSSGVRWPYGYIRGGCVIPYQGKLLRFFHSSTDYGIGRVEHRYYIGAMLMESKPPFTILQVSRKPILYGSEVDNFKSAERKSIHHWKENVAFPCGVIPWGKEFILSAGINDSACALVKIKTDQLHLS